MGVARGRVHGVAGCVDGNIRGDLGVITNPDPAGIQDGAVVIDKGILPDLDPVPVIAVEGRVDKDVLSLSEQFFDDCSDPFEIRPVDCIQFLCQPAGAFLRFKHGAVRNVQQALVHSFKMVHASPRIIVSYPPS